MIDCDPAYERWTLRAELDRTARRRRTRRFGSAWPPWLLLSSVLVLGAASRRVACTAATADEQAMWDRAVAQRAGDGLRAYLQTYPRGAYVDEARARLDGCSRERVERLGPAREVRYPLTVNANRTDLRSSPGEAHDDAVMRGHRDAATSCALLDAASQVLSSAAQPTDWKCIEDGHRYTCGFDGAIVCRVRDRIVSNEERCGRDP